MLEILFIEDNAEEIRLIREALAEADVANNLHAVTDGEKGLEFLQQRGRYANAPRPDIVVLDLNLPKKDGREVLSAIKSDDELKRIPVVILSTSSAQEDVLRAYELHGNCYVAKPTDLAKFASVIKLINDFWLTVATLPPKN